MSNPDRRIAPLLVGCAGLSPSDDEIALFAEMQPFGFILFARNVRDPDQVRALCAALRRSVGRPDAPVLIDQEGGRVARLGPPHWPSLPGAAAIGALWRRDGDAGLDAAYWHGRALGAMLADLGITIDCTPVLDIAVPGADPVIGDRAFCDDPEGVAALGQRQCLGLLDAGVLPVLKHMPGHGRASVDSHQTLPVIEASAETLEKTDFVPFRTIAAFHFARNLWGMVAHVVYSGIDADNAASVSPTVVRKILRGHMDFRGTLIADDIGMGALEGSIAQRYRAVLDAGVNLALHCSGDFDEMRALAAIETESAGDVWLRWRGTHAFLAERRDAAQLISVDDARQQLDALLAGTTRPA